MATTSLKPERIIKKGKRTYGAIYKVPSGRRCYIAYRWQKDIFRSGEKDISTALRKETHCWAIDEETILEMRATGIKFIGVYVKNTGDRYLVRIEDFFDKTKIQLLNYERRGGALQRYMPIKHFRHRPGKIVRV